MTSKKHKRCLDRVYEAAKKQKRKPRDNDVIVCVQGDEPMLRPQMIAAVVNTLKKRSAQASLLAINILTKKDFLNPDTVKVVADLKGEVLYISRSPIPYSKNFSIKNNPKRIGGIFAFRYSFLKNITHLDHHH